MEQRPVQPMHDRHPSVGPLVRLRGAKVPFKLLTAGACTAVVSLDTIWPTVAFIHAAGFDVEGALPLELLFDIARLRSCGSRGGAPDFGNAEDGLPPREREFAFGIREAESSGGEGALRPAVVDARQMPFHTFGGGVGVELVSDVDEVLHGGGINIIDGRKVDNDSLEGRKV